MTAYEFEYNGTTYTMEFDRDAVKAAEAAFGFDVSNVNTPSTTNMENLFHASLLKHHPNLKPSTVSMLYAPQSDKVGLFQDLVSMYMETVVTLLVDGDEGKAVSRRKIG